MNPKGFKFINIGNSDLKLIDINSNKIKLDKENIIPPS